MLSPILSIQSHVVYGHVGNSAAAFPLQRLGCDVWPIHTVQFSSHAGYPGFRGKAFDADLIDECVAGLRAIGYTVVISSRHWSDGECIAVDPETGELLGGQDHRGQFGKAAAY